ncbi:hypothetical protein AB0B01_12650 [Streptomyces sp. NPDC044571]|uniref:hypothetical protein n=1 Tax=Streptomyces sp. NPDC044571 TaxID=3155371 RepID=UPI00340E9CC9
MSHRRIAATAAVLAAGISLVPGTAHAADGPADGKAHGVSASDLAAAKAKASQLPTFTSPAGRAVKSAAPASGGSKATAQAQGAAAATEPTYTVALKGKATSAHGISLETSVTGDPGQSLSVTIDWGDNGWKQSFGVSGSRVETMPHNYAEVGTYLITVTVEDTSAQTSVTNTLTVTTAGSDYTPYGPTRLLDTRDGTGAPQHKVAPYSPVRVKIGGNGGIPAGVTAVALNVTVTGTTSGGHVTAYAGGGSLPTTSNVNFAPGQTVPNLVIVPVGADGYVNLYNGGWESVDLIADVAGYFTHSASSGYTPMAPARFVDTRSGLGTAKGQLAGYGTFSTQITGLRGVGANATAVALNVTVTNPRSAGHLTVYPSGQSAPTASNVNFTAGQTIANSVIVPVGPDGRISVRNGGWNPADVIVDVVGYYSPTGTSAYRPTEPFRLLDTRDSNDWAWGPLGGRGYIYMPLGAKYPNDRGYVLNTTVTNTRDNGYLAVTPDPNTKEAYDNGWDVWPPEPTSSNLNWTVGKTVPNLVQASTGSTGVIDFWNQSDGDIDLIVDMFGFYEDN